MYETLFAFVIGKLALFANYHLLEKWLYTEKLPFCNEIFGTIILLFLWDVSLIFIMLGIQLLMRPYYITAKIYSLYLDMCLFSFANIMSYNTAITFHSLTLLCKSPHDINPILILIPFILLGTMSLFVEISILVKILLEYQKAPFIDEDDDYDMKKIDNFNVII